MRQTLKNNSHHPSQGQETAKSAWAHYLSQQREHALPGVPPRSQAARGSGYPHLQITRDRCIRTGGHAGREVRRRMENGQGKRRANTNPRKTLWIKEWEMIAVSNLAIPEINVNALFWNLNTVNAEYAI